MTIVAGNHARAADVAFGLALRAYDFSVYKSGDQPERGPVRLQSDRPEKVAAQAGPMAAVAEGVLFTRDLVNEPANVLTTTDFAARLAAMMRTYMARSQATRVVLAGYSYGADVLPIAYNRLAPDYRKKIAALLLIAPTRQTMLQVTLAERTGLIGALGDWVVHAAVGQQEAWLQRDISTMVGFNLSPIQLHDPGLVARVLTAASRLGDGASGLAMEMTESVAMADLELSRQVMADLRRAGIEIAIDDFGTGYSTLGRLRDLEVDYLKIDGSFLAGVPDSPIASGLLRGIVQLAAGAGMRPIAEGIETRAQWRFLVEHGCRRGQGFFFCGPVPADEMSEILAGQPVQIDFGATDE